MPDNTRRNTRRQSPGSTNTTALLGAAYRVLGLRIVEGVRTAGFPQRAAHSAVFANIDVTTGTRLTVLAQRATMTPQAMGELVDDLERMGYVRRVPDRADRRAKLVVLTDRGRGSVEAALSAIETIEGDLLALLGARGAASFGPGSAGSSLPSRTWTIVDPSAGLRDLDDLDEIAAGVVEYGRRDATHLCGLLGEPHAF